MPVMPISTVIGLSVALGIGLLIGAERERRKGLGPLRRAAGIRTFTVSSMLGAVAMLMGGVALLGTMTVLVSCLMLLAYWRTHTDDPGVTTELALVLTCLLGGLSIPEPALAAGVGAGIALLLASKPHLHRWLGSSLSERELHDVLVFSAIGLIAWPLAPDRFMGPWDAVNPFSLVTWVVSIMALQGMGYIALRTLGPARGLPVAGFFGGFISSTATIHAMGMRTQDHTASMHAAVTGASLSNVSTVIQLGMLVALVAPQALPHVMWPLAWGAVSTVAYGWAFSVLSKGSSTESWPPAQAGQAFNLKSAVLLTLTLTFILVVSAGLHDWLGVQALWPTAALTGLADAHAGALTALSLLASQKITAAQVLAPLLISLTANTLSKALVAVQSGGWPFAARVVPGLLCMLLATGLGAWVHG